MADATRWFERFRLVVGVAALGAIAYAVVGLAANEAFQDFVVLAAMGGAVLAGLLALAHRRLRTPVSVPDPFTRSALETDVLNFAHVRVAGLGGLGLLLVAAVIAVQYQLIAAALAFGLAGGLVGGGALILYRAHGTGVNKSA